MENKAKIEFLKKLNIWGAAEEFDVEFGLLEHDVETVRQEVQKCTKGLEQLPKLPLDRKPIVKSHDKYYVQDIVKLYSKNEKGEIVVKDQPKVAPNRIPSTLTNASIDLLRKKPYVGEDVYAMEQVGEPWVHCRIISVFHTTNNHKPVTTFKLRRCADSKIIRVGKFAVARVQDHRGDLRVPKRVIAGPDKDHLLSGIIGQDPCAENKNRYLVLMDNGSAHYFRPDQVYPILYQSSRPWADFKYIGIHNENLLAELVQFFRAYPRLISVEARVGSRLDVLRRGVYVPATVLAIECDVMKIEYHSDRKKESLYRGSPRFIKRAGIANRLLVGNISIEHLFPRLVANMHRYSEAGTTAIGDEFLNLITGSMGRLRICGAAIARKGTSRMAPPRIKVSLDSSEPIVDDRIQIPDLASLASPRSEHKPCTVACLIQPGIRTEKDVTDIIAEFRDVCDLKVPLLLGWKRILVKTYKNSRTPQITYVYVAPCGRIFERICDIKRYLKNVDSKLDIDYFTLEREVDLSRRLGEREVYHHEPNIAIDNKTKKPLENKNISLMNMVNEERLPVDFEYSNETFPHPMLKAKGFSFNHEFKSGCDCEDDCYSRVNCSCHRLNEETAGFNARNRGSLDAKCQYKGKRLLAQIKTALFECNSYCSCSSKCGNRVVQNGIRIRLEVRKTIDKGWGVFVLDDVPKGAFICTYAAELLDDADQYGDSDMYFADLDYLTIVESSKLSLDSEEEADEGVPVEPDDDSQASQNYATKKRQHHRIQDSDSDSGDETTPGSSLVPAHYLPRRVKSEDDKGSDDDRSDGFRRIHDILNESQDYTLDARMQGNVGRFFNHSCDPNAFVQNVFIESHDLRFPHVAFFTKRCLKADDEITWNYSYKVNSIEGRMIECNCGASNCQGRIL